MVWFVFNPFVVFVITFAGMCIAGLAGARIRQGRKLEDDRQSDLGLIVASTLTLLGLLIGFSFSMAASRYDQRKALEAAEANAIGTEYARADLLPGAAAAKVREQLKRYTALRIDFYGGRGDAVAADTLRLQSEMWRTVVAAAAEQPNPVVALAVAGMNEVLNSQAYTQAAWWNHIPISAGLLMFVIALLANGLVGYVSRSFWRSRGVLALLPLIVSVATMLIVDIDTPVRGLIVVQPRNLISLVTSLN